MTELEDLAIDSDCAECLGSGEIQAVNVGEDGHNETLPCPTCVSRELNEHIATLIQEKREMERRVEELEKKYEPTHKARMAALKRTIAYHKKEIEWKHRDDVDHVLNSVLRDMAQKELDKLLTPGDTP